MTDSFLADLGPSVLANGYNLLPLQPGKKYPTIKGWSEIEADREILDGWIWEAPARGVGVQTRHTPAVDLDITDEAVLAKLAAWCAEHIGDGPQRIGRPPRRVLLFRTDTPFRKMRSRAYRSPDGEKQQIEILGDGQQFAAFGIHPGTGKPYAWQNGSPADTAADLLPTLTAKQAAGLISFFDTVVPRDWVAIGEKDADIAERRSSERSAPLDLVRDAVKHIPNEDLHYDDWVRVGLALKGAVGEDPDGEGRELWHSFSEQAGKYDPGYAEERWQSFRPGKIGVGTLIFLASKNGWQWPLPCAEDEFDAVDIDTGKSPFSMAAAAAARQRVDEIAEAAGRSSVYSLSVGEAAARAFERGADPLIEGVMDQRTLGVIYGAPNAGKTFVALDIAAAVATGRTWNGRKVERGAVLYVAAETGSGILVRVAALQRKYELPDDCPLRMVPCPVDLFRKQADVNAIVAEAKSAADITGQPVRLIVVDTLAKTMRGADENSSKDMGDYLQNVTLIGRKTGSTVLLIHHTGKDQAKGMRGSSALLGDIDTELELKRAHGERIGFVKCGKQRDLPQFEDIPFALKQVHLGKDAEGRDLRTCVVDWQDARSEFDELLPISGQEAQYLAALVAFGRNVSVGEWDDAYRRVVAPGWDGRTPPPGCSDQSLRRMRTSLQEAGHIRRVSKGVYMACSTENIG